MTLSRFLNAISYGNGSRPAGVSVNRWNAMIIWLQTKTKEGYSLDKWDNNYLGNLPEYQKSLAPR